MDIRIINNKFSNNYCVPILLKEYANADERGRTNNKDEDIMTNVTEKCHIDRNKLHGFNPTEQQPQKKEIEHWCNPNIIHSVSVN